jgi:hypothetical protein
VVFRAGLVTVPVGRVNQHSEESARDLLIRPVEEIYLVPTPWFDSGAGLVGGFDWGGVGLRYQAYVLSGISNGIDPQTGLQNARQPPGADIHAAKAFSARLEARPARSVDLALSGYAGAYDPAGQEQLEMGEADAAVDLGTVSFCGEGVYAWTAGGTGSTGAPIPTSLYGGSAEMSLRLGSGGLRALLPADLADARFALSTRYSFVNLEGGSLQPEVPADTPNAFPSRERLDTGLSFRPMEHYVLRAEYEVRWQSLARRLDDDRAVVSVSASF